MELSGVVERLERVVATTGSPSAPPADIKAALKATVEVQSFVAARRAELVQALTEHPTAFPEAAIAETSGCTLGAATKERDRANTLGSAIAMAGALSDGAITTGHVDALTRVTRNLDDTATASLLDHDAALAAAAATQSIAEFDAYLKRKAKELDATDDEERLERQRRARRLRTWTDDDGMWNLKGRFDPDLGKDLARRIAAETRRRFTQELPSTAPADPIERTQHLEALALADLIVGNTTAGAASGPPVVVIDATQTNGAGGPVLDWGLPIELPASVLDQVLGRTDPEAVIVANGVVLHAPGRLNLGRTTRLANRAQRRALQGLYATCAVPGCAVHYDRCKLHHVIWWRNGGRTDLDNLLPVCQHHHSLLHENGWDVTLGANRELEIRIPDGTVIRAGPPKRSAASRGRESIMWVLIRWCVPVHWPLAMSRMHPDQPSGSIRPRRSPRVAGSTVRACAEPDSASSTMVGRGGPARMLDVTRAISCNKLGRSLATSSGETIDQRLLGRPQHRVERHTSARLGPFACRPRLAAAVYAPPGAACHR